MECECCGNKLNDEESESPCRDDNNAAICDNCYHNHYEFTCCKCEEYDHIDYQGGIGCLFVVVDADEAGFPTGTYRVLEHPYYVSTYFNAHLIESAVEKVSNQTHNAETNGYAIGHLCRECSDKIDE